MKPSHPLRLAAALLLLAFPAASRVAAQAYTPPPPPLTPCVPTKKLPCNPPATLPPPPAPEKFPFPGDPPAPATQPPAAAPHAAAPADPASRFPFPGEEPSTPPPGPASSSSSSSSSASRATADPDPPAPAIKDAASPEPTRPSRRRRLPKSEDLDARETKDLEVSNYYFSTGDFQAAYNRAKDALRLYPDDPEAHFALAQAAAKLNKTGESQAEYRTYLQLEPDGPHLKAAAKALGNTPK